MLTKNIEQMKAATIRHIEADAVIQGDYWQRDSNAVGGRGCFIGCLTHSSDAEELESRFGMPLMLVRLAESIFERLKPDDAVQFFGDIPIAIGKDGKDLSRVAWKFLAAELRELPLVDNDTQEFINQVIAGMDSLASGGKCVDISVARPADAVNDAAIAAEAAADAAAAATVDAAAHAANVASFVADADLAAATIRQRYTFLRLLCEAPQACSGVTC